MVDVKTGEALGPNQSGEVCIRGPSIMKGTTSNSKNVLLIDLFTTVHLLFINHETLRQPKKNKKQKIK